VTVPLGGAPSPKTLASTNYGAPGFIALDETSVYWADGNVIKVAKP
jgi:hypothetical protein